MAERLDAPPPNVIHLADRFPEIFEPQVADCESDGTIWSIRQIGRALGHERPFVAADEEGTIVYARVILRDAPQVDDAGNIIFGSLDIYPQNNQIYYHPASGVGMHLLNDIDHISFGEESVTFHADGETEYEEMTIRRDGIVSIVHTPYFDQTQEGIDQQLIIEGIRKEQDEFYAMRDAGKR